MCSFRITELKKKKAPSLKEQFGRLLQHGFTNTKPVTSHTDFLPLVQPRSPKVPALLALHTQEALGLRTDFCTSGQGGEVS